MTIETRPKKKSRVYLVLVHAFIWRPDKNIESQDEHQNLLQTNLAFLNIKTPTAYWNVQENNITLYNVSLLHYISQGSNSPLHVNLYLITNADDVSYFRLRAIWHDRACAAFSIRIFWQKLLWSKKDLTHFEIVSCLCYGQKHRQKESH